MSSYAVLKVSALVFVLVVVMVVGCGVPTYWVLK